MKEYRFNMRAPAKVNYILEVGAKRKDGYHEILTVFQTISLMDMLYFKDLPRDIVITTNAGDLGPMESNLVYRAAMILKRKYNINKGASIHLHKNIPVGAGLGGGSSDAAAALKGLALLWSLKISRDELARYAIQLGSDVPFFIEGGIAIGRGRGEKINRVNKHIRPQMFLGLVYPEFPISTAWAYSTWDEEKHLSSGKGIDQFMKALYRNDFEAVGAALFNDFEAIAIEKYPKISEIKQALLDGGALGSLMSGSGSSVFGIFNSAEDADSALAGIRSKGLGTTFSVTTI